MTSTGNETTSSENLRCAWCGKDLSGASNIVFLNGNQPVCDLCLMRAENSPIRRDWSSLEDESWKDFYTWGRKKE